MEKYYYKGLNYRENIISKLFSTFIQKYMKMQFNYRLTRNFVEK